MKTRRRDSVLAFEKSEPETMRKYSTLSRIAASTLALILTTAPFLAQDITGGAGVLVASADVEAKLGKGIFTPTQNKPHASKHLDTKTVTRPRSAHATRQTTAGDRQSSGNSGTS